MRKLLFCAVLAGVLVWSCPAVVLAQDCAPDPPEPPPDGLCDVCDIATECPGDASANCGCDWFDDMESYPLGLLAEVNGWEPWIDTRPPEEGGTGLPDPLVAAMISDEQNHTPGGSKSLKIYEPEIDQVRRFYGGGVYLNPTYPEGGTSTDDDVGYDYDVSSYWVFETWVYIPGDHQGSSLFLLQSMYDGTPAGTNWHVQFAFNSTSGFAEERHVTGNELPLILDDWTLVEVDIDLERDMCIMWYGESFLAGYKWGSDTSDFPERFMFLGTLDLYNCAAGGSSTGSCRGGAGTAWYADDMSMRAEIPPPCLPPRLECFPQRTFDVVDGGESVRCADYLFRVTNQNRTDEFPFDNFYLDIEAGKGGVTTTGDCRGGSSSTAAVTPPANWSVVKCTNWNNGHALFKFTADAPQYAIPLGGSVTGRLTVDPNLSVEVNGTGTGTVIPGMSVVISSAQSCGNVAFEKCASNDYGFGPTDRGQWAVAEKCYGFVNIPATSVLAKVLLVTLLVGGGTLLVLRSRRLSMA